MKAIELMIGDWVHNSYTNENYQIWPQFFSQINYQDKGQEKDLEDFGISPIPLTNEILEKNGFEPYEEDKDSFHGEDCVFLKQNDGSYGICLDKNLTISGKIYFVHELQHALRLCGIEKEIKL